MIETPKVTVNGKVLIISAKISDLSYFTNMNISTVKIYTQDGFSETPSAAQALACSPIQVNAKSCSIVLTEAQLGVSVKNNMFIVEFNESGTPASNTPCGMDTTQTYAAAFDTCGIFNAIVNFSKELNSGCEIPKDLMDMMLQYEAVRYAVEGGYITKAIELFKKFFKGSKFNYRPKSCGCYGR